MNTRILEGTRIRDQIGCMIELFNKIEILGTKIDMKTKVDMILETLLDSFM